MGKQARKQYRDEFPSDKKFGEVIPLRKGQGQGGFRSQITEFRDAHNPSHCAVCKKKTDSFSAWIGVSSGVTIKVENTHVASELRTLLEKHESKRKGEESIEGVLKKILLKLYGGPEVQTYQFYKSCSSVCTRNFYSYPYAERSSQLRSVALPMLSRFVEHSPQPISPQSTAS